MENMIGKKLTLLLALQAIDNKLDAIEKIKGSLPEEVSALKDELTGVQTRIKNTKEDLLTTEQAIKEYKGKIKEAQKLILKYEEQQMNVRNNREYDAITKEIDFQKLEIQASEKNIKACYEAIDNKKVEIEKTKSLLKEKKKELERKKEELTLIMEESKEEEKALHIERKEIVKKIEKRLVHSYEKIRSNVRNRLAVVTVKREACGGCFNTVPPQRQVDIREKKKIIVCEHCGRILADVEDLILEEDKKATKTRSKAPTG
ncbi:MAG: C4-type zinc ribbon domain-containing protein [Cytophagales bacterium]|nr:C4-type zinc ribbon domain-containing protein [Cytophagales bacterium]